jgi:AcrR family transcriptional regulator
VGDRSPTILEPIVRVNEQTRADTRRALLAAAAWAFSERGYHDTTIDSVSETAGVAKGTIYNYFSSKEAVLHALLAEACQLAADAADATPDSAPTHRRLEAFVEGNLRWARRRKPLALLFARELLAGDARTKALIRQAAAPCVRKVAAILQAGIERGELTAHAPPELLAFTFIALTNMLLLQSWESAMPWPRATDLPTTATALFLHGVTATDPPV